MNHGWVVADPVRNDVSFKEEYEKRKTSRISRRTHGAARSGGAGIKRSDCAEPKSTKPRIAAEVGGSKRLDGCEQNVASAIHLDGAGHYQHQGRTEEGRTVQRTAWS